MSGIEIVAGVAAIVTAFNGSVKLYRSWKEKRKERLEAKENQNLEQSLTIGGTTVQREYDSHFAKLGPKFAVGDGKSLVHARNWAKTAYQSF
jgi:preprotein translocase subunit SecA